MAGTGRGEDRQENEKAATVGGWIGRNEGDSKGGEREERRRGTGA